MKITEEYSPMQLSLLQASFTSMERAAVVRFLRKHGMEQVARAIENGEHHQ